MSFNQQRPCAKTTIYLIMKNINLNKAELFGRSFFSGSQWSFLIRKCRYKQMSKNADK